MRILKVTLGWVLGTTIYELILSLWKNEGMDWLFILNFSVAGFIGILIGFGLRNIFKKDKS